MYRQIEKRMANCQWGEMDEKKKIHWAKWGKLTKAKEAGGMDFKGLKSINEALLTKQLWRLLK